MCGGKCGILFIMNATTVIDSLLVNQLSHAYGVISPSFSWKLSSARPAAAQTAYRLRVFEGREGNGAPVWDSGEVTSSETLAIRYAGPALKSACAYTLKIRTKRRPRRE